MGKDIRKIRERLAFLEQEKSKLMELRKEEIFNILQKNKGVMLDNRLLAGLSIYASNVENQGSELLNQLINLGQAAMPSKSSKAAIKSTN